MSGVRIYLARHGETDWNNEGRWQGQTDVPLNETGRRQAVALGKRLRSLGLAKLGSSDLLRATETAKIVGAEVGLVPAFADPRLRERGFGVFEGLTRAEVESRYPEHWRSYQINRRNVPPDGEPFDALIARSSAALLDHHIPAPTLFVTHGGVMRSLWASSMFSAQAMQDVQPLENGAVVTLTIELVDRQLRLRQVELLPPG
ncbi:MAG: hypothetical protein RJA70_4254 [Pseudomonadota bacterium]|jgi:probable phosphoglycerate mutase